MSKEWVETKDLAKILHNKNYREDLINEINLAEDNNLVICYVKFDSLRNLMGLYPEYIRFSGALEKGINILNRNKVTQINLPNDKSILVEYKPQNARCEWIVTSDLECESFHLLGDGQEIFCIGIVFNYEDIKK